jgi:hypothetical protein
MGAFNALVDGHVANPDPGPPPPDGGATAGPEPHHMGVHIADLQGTRPLAGDHNIPFHVGCLGLAALLLVVALRLAGFKFAVAGNIGRG